MNNYQRYVVSVFFSGLLLICFSATANITVVAESSVNVDTDELSISVDIRKNGVNRNQVENALARDIQSINRLLVSLGLPSEKITQSKRWQQTQLPSIKLNNIEINQSDLVDKQEGKIHLTPDIIDNQYLTISQRLNIEFLNTQQQSSFIAQVSKLSSVTVGPIEISPEQRDELYQTALISALAKAKNKALAIARASQVSLERIVNVEELAMSPTQGMNKNNTESFGNSTIKAKVKVVFQINP